ncbi:LytTR family DNA-binding domain-containing protein [Nitratireductor sp. XY-223]|uniref:LytTR family DNA-binding domain-containing protein n=1 Tax=Nitratireductor sp. XY-223 TaxID=2561926 RepID=UPI0010A9DBC2|nr:LytTR family DNA-binding domain-containing protein [Nitratireductor sp. XY-223]
MTDRTLQFTLREWRRLILAPQLVVAVTGAGLVLGISGPFGTYATMPPVPRILYWLIVAHVTFGIGLLDARLIAEHTPARHLGVLPAYAVAGVVGGVPITVAVELINWLGAIDTIDDWQEIGVSLAYCTAINFCICMAAAWYDPGEIGDEPLAAAASMPRLLKRLPIELRGSLSHLSMQDHYVEVVTEKGSKLILMRLADAISETEPVAGIQVHRSHWVALGAVARTQREKERYFVEMKNGAVLPISRSCLPAARDAGLVVAA